MSVMCRLYILVMPAACCMLCLPHRARRRSEVGMDAASFRFVTCLRRIFWDRGDRSRRGGGMSSITVRVPRFVVRTCITKGDHHAPLQQRQRRR